MPIARLNRFHLRRGGRAVPVLNRHLVGAAMNRDAEIVHLATQHKIQRIDRSSIDLSSIEEGVTVAKGTVVLRDRVLPIATVDLIGVIAEPARQPVVARCAVQCVVAQAAKPAANWKS